jgi:hypothetical protein
VAQISSNASTAAMRVVLASWFRRKVEARRLTSAE